MSLVQAWITDLRPRPKSGLLLVAGVFSAFALGPWGVWPASIVGLSFLGLAVSDVESARARVRFGWWFFLGMFALGAVFLVDLTAPGYVVAVPVLALVMAIPFAVRPRHETRQIVFVAAVVVGTSWRWIFPFGGVPMGDLALGQVNGPLLTIARVCGALGVVAAVAMLAAGLAAVVQQRLRWAAGWFLAVGVLLIAGAFAPDGEPIATLTAAAVQGGGELGTNAETSNQLPVFNRHLEATEDAPDGALVVWPESAVTVDEDFVASRRFDQLAEIAERKNLTLVVGVTQRAETTFDNLAVVIGPDGEFVDEYQKVHLVPFGEYIPLRSFVDRFADLSLVPRDAVAGSGPGIVDTPAGPIAVGISFEVYFQERIRSGVSSGGEIIVNPTLASSYRTTHVPEQSLASARLRAVESGRWVVQASTTGYSAIVDPDGDVIERSGLSERRVVSTVIERRTGSTWATSLGKIPVTVLFLVALGAAGTWPNPRAALVNWLSRRRR